MDVYLSYCFNYCIREAFSNHCKIDEMYCVRRSPTNFFYFHCWFSLIWYLHIIYSQPASSGLLWPQHTNCHTFLLLCCILLFFVLSTEAFCPLSYLNNKFSRICTCQLESLKCTSAVAYTKYFYFVLFFFFLCTVYCTSQRFATKSRSTVGGFLVWVGGWFCHLFPENQRNSQAE